MTASETAHAIPTSNPKPIKILVAASGTGGHLFPAIAVAQVLTEQGYDIEWLGVPERLEHQLVPQEYPLHVVAVEGLQGPMGIKTIGVVGRFLVALWQTRQLLKRGQFQGVLTTGGYIAAPAILAARSLNLPSILHESNAIPGKVTRWLSRRCSAVALGFPAAQAYLPHVPTQVVGTPVRQPFLNPSALEDLAIPEAAFLVVIMGGSQGAVALNRLARQCAPAWLDAGLWIVHLTGDRDPDCHSLQHAHYIERPFYTNMAGLLQRADLAISRSGAGSVTELAITGTPAILVPYPYAAEDHQFYNAQWYTEGGAGKTYRESEITPPQLTTLVLELHQSPEQLRAMSDAARQLATPDSHVQVARLVQAQLQETLRQSS